MTDYPKEKLFRIYAGDIGSDAYKHQYVNWLEVRLAAVEAECLRLQADLGHGRDERVKLRAERDEAMALLREACDEARSDDPDDPEVWYAGLVPVEWFDKAEARVKELESRGILNMDEVVNQFYEGE